MDNHVIIEYAGGIYDSSDIIAKARKASGKTLIKELNVYFQPETGMIYFTADGVEGIATIDDDMDVQIDQTGVVSSRSESFINSLSFPENFEAVCYKGMSRIHLKYKGVGFAVVDAKRNNYNIATREECIKAIGVKKYDIVQYLGANKALMKNISYDETDMLYKLIDYIQLFEDARDAFDRHYLISRKEIEASEEMEFHIQKEVDVLISQEKDVDENFNYIAHPEERKEINKKDKESGALTYPRVRQKRINALKRAKYTCEFDPNHKSFISKTTGKRYMETHHLIPLEYWEDYKNSLDVEANIVCLCSNCHNEIHYGMSPNKLIEVLYEKRKIELDDAGISIKLSELFDIYNGKRVEKES